MCLLIIHKIIYNHYFITLVTVEIFVFDGAKSGDTVTYYSGYVPNPWLCSGSSGYKQWNRNNSIVICGNYFVSFLFGRSLALEDAGTYTCEGFDTNCNGEYVNPGFYCNITTLNNDCSPIVSKNITVVIIGK